MIGARRVIRAVGAVPWMEGAAPFARHLLPCGFAVPLLHSYTLWNQVAGFTVTPYFSLAFSVSLMRH